MIINVGQRTDIPAFYSDWFYKRIEEGYVMVRNPFFADRVTKYLLDPNLVDILCFCTKNPQPMLARLAEIAQFNQFWFVTITPYNQTIEPRVPRVSQVIDSTIELAKKVGKKSICWRYDPIFLDDTYTLEFHLKAFASIAARLTGYVDTCVVSFIDLYQKTTKNFPRVKAVEEKDQQYLIRNLVIIGQKYGFKIKTCAEDPSLAKYGADVSGCMTKEVLEAGLNQELSIPSNQGKIRQGCDCLLGNDIGAYNSCLHGCKYCYANYDNETVLANYAKHDKSSPLLIGRLRPGDQVRLARQRSFINKQIKFKI